MDTKNIVTAKVHANIAIIKYWGKTDEQLKTPCNSSISFLLEKFYTLTTIIPDKTLTHDVFYLNDVLQDEKETQKITKILNYFRPQNEFALIKSRNSMPTSAGLSSSSSGLAALVACANTTYKANLSTAQLSYYARLGSGSACRSFYGPFAIWQKEDDEKQAIAYPLPCELDLSMIILVLSDQKKAILSRDGMLQTKQTSTLFQHWVAQANLDAKKMVEYMRNNQFQQMGQLMESNTRLMHETTNYATPAFTYLNADTWEAIRYVETLQQAGINVYYTMDAGPNVKLLCESKDVETIKAKLHLKYAEEKIVVSKAASGFEILEGDYV